MLTLERIAIDSIHNTRRKGNYEGSKSMNNKSPRNYSIIIMAYVIFKVDVTYHESFYFNRVLKFSSYQIAYISMKLFAT